SATQPARQGRPVDAGGRGCCGNRAGRDHNGTPRQHHGPVIRRLICDGCPPVDARQVAAEPGQPIRRAPCTRSAGQRDAASRAVAALPGTALGRLGEPSTASAAAWAAAGAAARMLHDAPLPPWPGRSPGKIASELDGECEWLVTNDVLPAGLVTRNRRIAEAA